jgi:integrase/recombinase XerD
MSMAAGEAQGGNFGKSESGLKCPECSSGGPFYRDGLRYANTESIQRWFCRRCGYRFSERRRQGPMEKPLQENFYCPINTANAIVSKRQVCELLTEGSKNLATVESQREKPMWEGTTLTADAKGKIVEFAWQLKKDGAQENTIKVYLRQLNALVKKGANLFEPETIKDVIANQKWSNATKSLVVAAYAKFASTNNILWKPPKYESVRKLPFIPLEQEIDDLIASCGKKTSVVLRLIKETALRIGEAIRLKWTDVDFERNTVTLNEPEKHGQPRMFKTSDQLVSMLHRLPKSTAEVFGKTQVVSIEQSLRIQRNRTAEKLGNPRLRQIHFHSLRHWKASTEYQKTKDLLHVMRKLGHRNINTTLIYTHLIDVETEEEYHSAVAKTIEESRKLVEAGFEFVCSQDGLMLFKKRK